jgi:hypothetical protein
MEKEFKTMAKEEKIITIAKYIIKNKATIEMTANHFNISISSVKKYINNPNNLQEINYDAYQAVKKVQDELIKIGNRVGGANGYRQPTITDYELEEIAQKMIDNNLTIQEASDYFEIPTSTLYDNLTKLKDSELKELLEDLYDGHKKTAGGRR